MLFNRRIGIYLAALLIFFALRTPAFINDFMDSDEAVYGAVALATAHGKTPYRDAVERKTPLIFFTYAAIFKLFGDGNMLAVHWVGTFWLLATAWVLAQFMGKLIGPEIKNPKYRYCPHLAAAFYLLGSVYYIFEWLAANCEVLLDLPLALGFLSLLIGLSELRPLYFAGAGLAFGLAFLFKQTAIIPFLGACLVMELRLLQRLKASLWQLTWQSLLMIGGFVLPVALSYLYFYLQDAHRDYLYWAWLANFQYVHDSFDPSYVLKKFATYTSLFILASFPIVVCAALYFKKAFRFGHRSLLLISWFGSQFVALWVSGKFYTHYYFHLLAPLALLAAIGILELKKKWQPRVLAAAFAVAVISSSLWSLRDELYRWYGHGHTPPNYREIAKYIETHTETTDRIFVWGYSPEIYVLSKRVIAGRFVFCDYLTGRIAGHPRVLDPEFDTSVYAAPNAWDLFRADLSRQVPVYIIDTSPGNFHQYGKYPMARYPWLQGFVEAHYDYETTVAQAVIYRRKANQSRTGARISL